MDINAFYSFLTTHAKSRLTEHEKDKIAELADKLDEDLRQRLADNISFDWDGILARQPLTLKSLLQFLRAEIVLVVSDKVKKTRLTAAPKDMIDYDKRRWLTAFWWKKEMQKLPEWARSLNFSDESKKRKVDE